LPFANGPGLAPLFDQRLYCFALNQAHTPRADAVGGELAVVDQLLDS
jgi:hypothetical protein